MLALVCCLNIVGYPAAAGPATDGPAVSASLEIPPGRIYVGQAVQAHLVVSAGAARPEVSIGRGDGVEVVLLGGFEVVTHGSDEIGSVRNVANTYRFPVRIVPRKAGTLAIPPIRVQVEGRKGVATTRAISAIPPPALGRTAAFLGGIGPIKATAEATPGVLRLGETFEYRITLSGPGAAGSADAAAFPSLAKVGAGWRIEPLPSDGTVVPPSKTLRVRVRPDRPGTFELGSFPVSFLDPGTGKYLMTTTRPLTVRVVDVPVFDAASVALPESRARPPLVAFVSSAAGLAVAAALIVAARYRVVRARTVDPRRVAGELVARLRRASDRDIPKVAEAAIAEYFARVGGRPPGAVTPDEARRWAGRLSGREDVADAAGRLAQSCDRTLYSETTPSSSADTRALALFVMTGLGESGQAEKPREAPGTA